MAQDIIFVAQYFFTKMSKKNRENLWYKKIIGSFISSFFLRRNRERFWVDIGQIVWFRELSELRIYRFVSTHARGDKRPSGVIVDPNELITDLL